MKVAVITPYYKEPIETLRRCHDSVAAQTHPCTHFMIADGHAVPDLGDWPVEHIILTRAHGDVGNTPRSIGAISALNRGFDAVAYLDADNWYHPEHIESLVETVRRAGVPMAISDRFVVALDGTVMDIHEESHPDFADTSCIFHTAQAARMIPMWAMMPPVLGVMGDRVFVAIANLLRIPRARTGRKTLYYESNYWIHYHQAGLPQPPEPRSLDAARVLQALSQTDCMQRLGFPLTAET